MNMKFKATNINGETVTGVGIAPVTTDEHFSNNEGGCFGKDDNLFYLFTDVVEWIDDREFNITDFEIVMGDSIEVRGIKF